MIVATAVGAQAAEPAVPAPRLAGYHLALGPVVVSNVTDDLSGVTFCPADGSLYMVINGDASVVKTDTNGVYQGRIALSGFNDPEDIVWIGGRKFALVEERLRNLVLFDMPAPGGSVQHAACARLLVEPQEYQNVGLEGVTWDAAGNRFFIVKEKQPRRIYEVRWTPGQPARIGRPWDATAVPRGVTDLSAICFDDRTGRLLLLSDESSCVVECATDGGEVARFDLKAGQAGLRTNVKQPEGLCLDRAGTLYVVCEPNLLYVFTQSLRATH